MNYSEVVTAISTSVDFSTKHCCCYRSVPLRMGMIDVTRLRSVLHYDPDTGHLTWLVRTAQRIQVGDRAGAASTDGYRQIRVFGHNYKEHRLIWLHVYGEWPDGWLDHINGDPSDNRIANLRLASPSQNSANSRKRSTSPTLKGVSLRKDGRWHARVVKDRKLAFSAYFRTEAEAHAAYVEAARRIHGGYSNSGHGGGAS